VQARVASPQPSSYTVLYKNCEKPFFLESFLHVSINDENYEQGFQQLVRGCGVSLVGRLLRVRRLLRLFLPQRQEELHQALHENISV
jgi:hypothetical protein